MDKIEEILKNLSTGGEYSLAEHYGRNPEIYVFRLKEGRLTEKKLASFLANFSTVWEDIFCKIDGDYTPNRVYKEGVRAELRRKGLDDLALHVIRPNRLTTSEIVWDWVYSSKVLVLPDTLEGPFYFKRKDNEYMILIRDADSNCLEENDMETFLDMSLLKKELMETDNILLDYRAGHDMLTSLINMGINRKSNQTLRDAAEMAREELIEDGKSEAFLADVRKFNALFEKLIESESSRPNVYFSQRYLAFTLLEDILEEEDTAWEKLFERAYSRKEELVEQAEQKEREARERQLDINKTQYSIAERYKRRGLTEEFEGAIAAIREKADIKALLGEDLSPDSFGEILNGVLIREVISNKELYKNLSDTGVLAAFIRDLYVNRDILR